MVINTYTYIILLIMSTTFQVDDDLANRFRDAVREKYPHAYGKIKEEVKNMFENHIKFLKGG